MFTPNQKLQVCSNHHFHANRIGYFQFIGGPNQDCLVLALNEPGTWIDGCRTLISVGLSDCQEAQS